MAKKIRSILVANRGEIAFTIIQIIRDTGRKAIAVYETPDSGAAFIRLADRAVQIGDGPVLDYLNIHKIIRAALETGADAIHPGYGFLAESPEFAEACEKADLVLIGPPSGVMRMLGDKIEAKLMAQKSDAPILPGTGILPPGEDAVGKIERFAQEHGYPILLKAVEGGGGRGIRNIEKADEIRNQLNRVRHEAQLAFGSDSVYAESFIPSPRHIEIQILADTHGNVVHLGSRDCSIQRRHQKLIEVAPAEMPADIKQSMCETAVRIGSRSGYVNAGTVEFLFDPNKNLFWFMEVNPRLQVEYTVTEMITGVGIIRQQIEIAEGNPIGFAQKDIHPKGCAIQVRINAEDPQKHFLPSGGKKIDAYRPPTGPGIRVDGMLYEGYVIPTAYDSMIAKLTVWGSSWFDAVDRLKKALSEFIIRGPETTISLYAAVCNEPDFGHEVFNTSYLDTHPTIYVSGI